MRKLRVAFAATMLMIMALTAGVMAASSEGYVRNISYEWQSRSSKVLFHAIGNADYRTEEGATGVCYTKMDNVSGYSQPVHVSIRGFILNEGWQPVRSNSATIEPGSSISTSAYTRYFNKRDRYYYHTGYVYVASGTTIVQEEYAYTANQIH